MKYEVKPSNQFKKDVRLANKRGYDLELLTAVRGEIIFRED